MPTARLYDRCCCYDTLRCAAVGCRRFAAARCIKVAKVETGAMPSAQAHETLAAFGIVLAVAGGGTAFAIYVASIHFTIKTNGSCCPSFIAALIAAGVIAALDQCVASCGESLAEAISRFILNLAIVSSISATFQSTVPCVFDVWLKWLIFCAAVIIALSVNQFRKLLLRALLA